jgi:2-hydroxychromene-2-carboxylate isomerase
MSTPPEYPPPIRLPGQPAPAEPYASHARADIPDVVDEDTDRFGVEDVAARIAQRLARIEPHAARMADDGEILLAPPLAPGHDRIAGPASGRATLVVFGAHGAPSSRSLGAVLDAVRQRHPATVGVAWRHYPDPVAHPRAVVLALAVEAAARAGKFWTLTRELLRLRHDDPGDLHRAIVRSSLDPNHVLEAMRSAAGEDRIADDVASALSSGVTFAPALFIAGERYRGEVRPASVLAAIDSALGGV